MQHHTGPQIDSPKQLVRLLLLRQASGLPPAADVPAIDDEAIAAAPRPVSREVWESLWREHLAAWPETPPEPERVHATVVDAGIDPAALSRWLSERSPVRVLGSAEGRAQWDAALAIEKDSNLVTVGVLPVERGWSYRSSAEALLVAEDTRLDAQEYRKLLGTG